METVPNGEESERRQGSEVASGRSRGAGERKELVPRQAAVQAHMIRLVSEPMKPARTTTALREACKEGGRFGVRGQRAESIFGGRRRYDC